MHFWIETAKMTKLPAKSVVVVDYMNTNVVYLFLTETPRCHGEWGTVNNSRQSGVPQKCIFNSMKSFAGQNNKQYKTTPNNPG